MRSQDAGAGRRRLLVFLSGVFPAFLVAVLTVSRPAVLARLDRFVYRPADGAFGLVLSFVRGVAAYVSGRIAKLAPDAIRLETPAAIVGVRGTSLAIRLQP